MSALRLQQCDLQQRFDCRATLGEVGLGPRCLNIVNQANWFLLRVADGDGIAAAHPIAVLRARVTRLRVSGGRINETEGLALTIQAWNAYRAGEQRSRLQIPRGGLSNETFPVPG